MMDPSALNVSRETFLLLERYVALLQKWNSRINLIGRSTEQETWQRHIKDSLQLLPLIPNSIRQAADLGSGAGLPGLVLAIARPEIHFTLVEQDQRKSAFLQEAVATLGLKNVTLAICDLYTVKNTYDLITARALASLDLLCQMAAPLGQENSLWLFPKGKNFATEVEEAQKHWSFNYQLIPSATQEESSIVSITELLSRNQQVMA